MSYRRREAEAMTARRAAAAYGDDMRRASLLSVIRGATST